MKKEFEKAIESLLALAYCSIPELSCIDCPKHRECRDETELLPCESWDYAEIIEAVAILKERNNQ